MGMLEGRSFLHAYSSRVVGCCYIRVRGLLDASKYRRKNSSHEVDFLPSINFSYCDTNGIAHLVDITCQSRHCFLYNKVHFRTHRCKSSLGRPCAVVWHMRGADQRENAFEVLKAGFPPSRDVRNRGNRPRTGRSASAQSWSFEEAQGLPETSGSFIALDAARRKKAGVEWILHTTRSLARLSE